MTLALFNLALSLTPPNSTPIVVMASQPPASRGLFLFLLSWPLGAFGLLLSFPCCFTPLPVFSPATPSRCPSPLLAIASLVPPFFRFTNLGFTQKWLFFAPSHSLSLEDHIQFQSFIC